MSNVSKDFLDRLSYLSDKYKGDFKIIRSEYDIDDLDYMKAKIHGPFLNGDPETLSIIEKAINSGEQAALQAVSKDKLLVHTGKKIIGVIKSPSELRVSKIMRRLEEIHNSFRDSDGHQLLLGGYDSYIYPEKILGVAVKANFSLYKSFQHDDENIISEIMTFINKDRVVAIVADTKTGIIEMYLEPSLNVNKDSNKNTSNGGFIFPIIFWGIIGGIVGAIAGTSFFVGAFVGALITFLIFMYLSRA